jgi:hypothetical protein
MVVGGNGALTPLLMSHKQTRKMTLHSRLKIMLFNFPGHFRQLFWWQRIAAHSLPFFLFSINKLTIFRARLYDMKDALIYAIIGYH